MATTGYTIDGILKSPGYSDPMTAARQQARMILLGRLARYQAEIHRLENKWDTTLAAMRQKYEQKDTEDFAVDDDYVQWQWYADAAAEIESQLDVLTAAKMNH